MSVLMSPLLGPASDPSLATTSCIHSHLPLDSSHVTSAYALRELLVDTIRQ